MMTEDVKNEQKESCSVCANKGNIPGDAHIKCCNPPPYQFEIGSGGEERYKIAKDMAIEKNAVVRCIWPGSGIYPLCFDSNTVFACANFKRKV